jgi:hypothetical protein
MISDKDALQAIFETASRAKYKSVIWTRPINGGNGGRATLATVLNPGNVATLPASAL